MSKSLVEKIKISFIVLIFGILMSACTHTKERMDASITPPNKLPFTIGFDENDKPLFFDTKGNIIQPKSVDFPIKAEYINSMQTISVVKVEGSCFYLIEFMNEFIRIDLPEYYCSK